MRAAPLAAARADRREAAAARGRGRPWLSRCGASPSSPTTWPTTTDRTLRELADEGRRLGLELVVPADEAAKHGLSGAHGYRVVDDDELRAVDLCLVLGGDGTILRALGRMLGSGVPTTGVNFGNVGFLAGMRQADWRAGLERITRRQLHDHRAAHRRGALERRPPHGRQRHRARPRALAARRAARLRSLRHPGRRDAVRRHDRRLTGRLDRLQPVVRRAARGLGRRRPRAQLHRPPLARLPAARAAPRPRHPREQRLARPTKPRCSPTVPRWAACAAARPSRSPPARPARGCSSVEGGSFYHNVEEKLFNRARHAF